MSNLKRFAGIRREAGFTLAEMLIAMAIFIIAATVAFLLYDNAQRSFKQGEELTEQQQVTRVAFEKMVADLRMAGFNYNPTGNPTVTDEQIEGAWSTAVTLRGDFDAEDATASATPETTLATGSPFSIVSIGNDEIVTYVLAKDAGNLGGNTLTFFADKSSPRDITADQIDINNTALAAQGDPPYTLYRITLNSTGAAVKEPLAENIRSLTFTYYDANGVVVDPANMTGVETAAARANRASIRRITVDVEGLTPNNDIRYLDASDSDTDTQRRRKFSLVSDVQARNLGMVGAADPDNTPPTTPTGLSACAGHCGGLVLEWNDNPATQAVILYNIKFGTSAGALNSVTTSATPPSYLNALIDTNNYYFAIQAQDSSGNKSQWSTTIGPITLVNNTIPEQVLNLAAAPSGPNINLSWDAVVENTDAGASAAVGGCDPDRPALRDSGGYKVYRQKSPGGTFNLTDAGVVSIASVPNTYTDSGIVTCATYGYRVTSVDSGCTAPQEGLPSTMATSATSAAAEAAAPINTMAEIISGGHADVRWDPVTQDTATPTPNTIAVEAYNLYEALVDTGLGETPSSVTYTPVPSNQLSCSTATQCVHNNGGAGSTATVHKYYKVAATTACSPPYDEGDLSTPFLLSECDFFGTPVISSPTAGEQVTAGTVPIQINVLSPTSTYTTSSMVITGITDPTYSLTLTDNSWSSSSPNFAANWDASGLSGFFTLAATVTQADGCVKNLSTITVEVVTPVSCCLSVSGTPNITQGGSPPSRQMRISFTNTCSSTLSVDQFTIQMTDSVNRDAELTSGEFDSAGLFFDDNAGQSIEASPFTGTISPVQTLTTGAHTLTFKFKDNITTCPAATPSNSFAISLRYTRPETGATTYTCTINTSSYVVSCL